MAEIISPLILERYELKYLIPESLVGPISAYVEAFCNLDYYSQISEDKFYTINTLYFDSDDFKLLRFKQSSPIQKVSLRVRSYGNSPVLPYFFEIKKKYNQVIKKTRSKIFFADLESLFHDSRKLQEVELASQENVKNFLYWYYQFAARPKVLTQYRRKAYISNVDDYARVTFDRELRYQREEGFNVAPNSDTLIPYDYPDLYDDKSSLIVLELKCNTKVPFWMIDLIRFFNLEQVNFSKFENSLITAFAESDLVLVPGSKIFR